MLDVSTTVAFDSGALSKVACNCTSSANSVRYKSLQCCATTRFKSDGTRTTDGGEATTACVTWRSCILVSPVAVVVVVVATEPVAVTASISLNKKEAATGTCTCNNSRRQASCILNLKFL